LGEALRIAGFEKVEPESGGTIDVVPPDEIFIRTVA